MNSIIHNTAQRRYEMTVENQLATADYQQHGDTLTVTHVYVPEALRGANIGKKLMATVVDDVHAQGLKIAATCSYAALYLKRKKLAG